MKKNILYTLAFGLLLPLGTMAQDTDSKHITISKNIEVSDENGVKTVTVTTTENGNTTTEIYTGVDADNFLENEHSTTQWHQQNGAIIDINIDSIMGGNHMILLNDMMDGGFNFEFDMDSLMSKCKIMMNGAFPEEMKKMMEELEKNGIHMSHSFSHDTIINSDGNSKHIKIIIDGDESNNNEEEVIIIRKGNGDITMDDKNVKVKTIIIAHSVIMEDVPAEKKKNELEDVSLSFYPNPGNGDFTLEFTIDDEDETVITIHDLTGKIIYSETVKGKGDYKKKISLDEPSGVYIVKVQQGKKAMTKKLIIN